jgi:WD40 repeat protein
VVLIDDRSGETVAGPITAGRDLLGVEVSPDGALVALGFGDPDAADPHGVLVVVDAETGAERFRFDTPVPASTFAFDRERDELVAGMIDGGEIITVDLETGAVVATTRYRAASRLLDLGVMPDGLLLAVSEGQVEAIDRRVGPVGDPIALRDAGDARVRNDGTIVTRSSDGGLDVIELGGSALVEQQWEIDPFAEVAIDDGIAAAVTWPEGEPEVVDLATGERSTHRLVMPDGQHVEALGVRADSAGLWAIDLEGRLTRWESDRMTDLLDLGGRTLTYEGDTEHWVVLLDTGDGLALQIVDLEDGAARISGSVAVADGSTPAMSGDGTPFVLDPSGTLRSYDPSGSLSQETATGVVDATVLSVDDRSGRVAIASRDDLVVVAPASGESTRLDHSGGIVHLGFARDGSMLAVTRGDGTVRLWDLDRSQPAGLVWDGTGAVSLSGSWYDADTDTLWVSTSGRIVQIPLDPARWVERACEIVGRDFTEDEWNRFVPGDDPLQSACA